MMFRKLICSQTNCDILRKSKIKSNFQRSNHFIKNEIILMNWDVFNLKGNHLL